jgi:GAF domain-containing protein
MSTDILKSTLTTLAEALAGLTSLPTATFIVEKETLTLLAASNLGKDFGQAELPRHILVNGDQLDKISSSSEKIFNLDKDTTNSKLIQLASLPGFEKAVFLPVRNGTHMQGLVLVGSHNGRLNDDLIQPLTKLSQLASTIFSQTAIIEKSEKCVRESESLSAITNAIKTPWSTTAFFEAICEQIKQNIGMYAFAGALYDEKTSSISIPYIFEDGSIRRIDAFPLGEGLISVLIRTKLPLLLNEDVQKQAEGLGAKIDGNPAKSWMGTPLVIENHAIGALIVQDLEKEGYFSEEDLDYLCTLANQVSRILFNARILDEAQSQINKLQTATEIARDISSALNLDELLLKAINLIRDRFNFYHASLFLIDPSEHNAVIREATGDAGVQLKRIGHKLAVGSKSIVGFVAGKGEPLVVNDIQKDATHLPNPMLPETRAEAAIPLKIGERILGVLDVQSTVPYSFNSYDISIFQTLADQLAIAVSNSELFGEIQEHLSQHRLLHHITTSAASGTTLEEALNSAVKGLQVTLGGDRVSILLSDDERKKLAVKAWVGYSENATDMKIPFGSGITGWVAAHRKPLRVNDITQDARYIMVSPNTRSELALPLIFRNDILGVLNVESEQVGAYNENDEEMLGTLAGSLAAIIANARLVDQIRKQAERERLLNEISSKIRRSTDMHTILTTTIQELHRVTGARKTQIDIGITPKEQEDFKTEPLKAREE